MDLNHLEKITYSLESQFERMIDVLQGIHEELVKINQREKNNEKKPTK